MGRIREALFSIWGQQLGGARFLDLFCASGGMGLEALSRGAESVVGMDRDRDALQLAKRNSRRLDCEDSVRWLEGELPQALSSSRLRGEDTFDLVFADPPYALNDDATILRALVPWVKEGSRIAIEHDSRVPSAAGHATIAWAETRRWGDSSVSFFVVRGTEEETELLEVDA
jgi:16S rRNA (guanine966-N2)-methyltransferase